MADINYHHLRYFWAIAHARSLTAAARELHVVPSALSIQLRLLEERLGHPLFERRHHRLVLTEAGRIALDYADTIFRAGEELASTLKGRPVARRMRLRVGAIATLSRNFQLGFVRPLLAREDVELDLRSGSLRELLIQLGAHTLDVVLTNEAVARDRGARWQSHLLAEQPVSLVSRRPKGRLRAFRFPEDLRTTALVLPAGQGSMRAAFDLLLHQAGVRPVVLAEVDDMALLRLIARESGALALVPPVVVQDELASGMLVERCSIPQVRERFWAVTVERRFPHPLLSPLLGAAGEMRE